MVRLGLDADSNSDVKGPLIPPDIDNVGDSEGGFDRKKRCTHVNIVRERLLLGVNETALLNRSVGDDRRRHLVPADRELGVP